MRNHRTEDAAPDRGKRLQLRAAHRGGQRKRSHRLGRIQADTGISRSIGVLGSMACSEIQVKARHGES